MKGFSRGFKRIALWAIVAALGLATSATTAVAAPKGSSTCKGRRCIPTTGSHDNPAALTGTAAVESEEWRMLSLINQYRAANGVAPLLMSIKLTLAADWMAVDSANRYYVGHTDSLGRYVDTRLHAFGISIDAQIGENACGGSGAELASSCVEAWKTSAGHNWAMLYAGFTVIGIGRATAPGGGWWAWTTTFSDRIEEGDTFQ